jgi:hypothetical protein
LTIAHPKLRYQFQSIGIDFCGFSGDRLQKLHRKQDVEASIISFGAIRGREVSRNDRNIASSVNSRIVTFPSIVVMPLLLKKRLKKITKFYHLVNASD